MNNIVGPHVAFPARPPRIVDTKIQIVGQVEKLWSETIFNDSKLAAANRMLSTLTEQMLIRDGDR